MTSMISHAVSRTEPLASDEPSGASFTSQSAGHAGRRRGRRFLVRRMAAGSPPRSAATPWNYSRNRREHVCRSWCRFATDECSSRLSRSFAAPPTSWRQTSQTAHERASRSTVRRRASLDFRVLRCPDRRLVFSINDFDETLPGPFEWDVKRLAASFTVAARDLGFAEGTRRSVVLAAARAYRDAIASFGGMRHIDVWYTRLDADYRQGLLGQYDRGEAADRGRSAKARTKDSIRALAKLCRAVDGELRIIGNPPLITPSRMCCREPNRLTSTG